MTGLGISGGPELRESFTANAVSAIVGTLRGAAPASAATHGIVEAAVGWWARLMALATVSPAKARTRVLSPAFLSNLARELGKTGSAVYLIDVDRGALQLDQAGSTIIYGNSPRPSGWIYDVEVYGPTGTRSVRVEADRVAHVRYQWDARAPWRGLSPLDGRSDDGASTLGGIEAPFSAEAASPSGYAWPMPDTGDRGRGDGDGDGDGDDDTDPLNDLKKSLQDANGRTLLLPTTAAGWGVGAGAAPPRDFTSPARFGFNPPDGTRQVRQDAERCIAFCYGLPRPRSTTRTPRRFGTRGACS